MEGQDASKETVFVFVIGGEVFQKQISTVWPICILKIIIHYLV